MGWTDDAPVVNSSVPSWRARMPGQDRTGSGHAAEDLRLEDVEDALRRGFGGGHRRDAGDRAVLQDVDGAEVGLDLGKGRSQTWPVGDVGDVRACGDAQLAELRHQLVELGGVAREQRDPKAGGTEALGERHAEAGAGADHGEGLGNRSHGR
jgi:hypothetical protein